MPTSPAKTRARSAAARKPTSRSARPRAAVASTAHRAGEREEKRDEIVRVARKLLLVDGYEATSMHRIAAEVEVAPNTLYWYFADKDAVLIAVLDSLLHDSIQQYAQRQHASLEAQLLWVVELLAGMESLIATVHARTAKSESVRAWHDGFHRLLEATIVEQLRARGLAAAREPEAALATMFIVEGMLAHRMAVAQQKLLITWLVSLVR